MENTYIGLYTKENDTFCGYLKKLSNPSRFGYSEKPDIFTQEEALYILSNFSFRDYNIEAIWNGSGDNTYKFRAIWEKHVPIVSKISTEKNILSDIILDELIEKDQENIKRARRKDHMLDWLNKYDLINQNEYIPPFYNYEYLEALEKADFWAKIPEYPDYEINSSTGAVRKISTKVQLPEMISSGGKVYFSLYNTALYGNTLKMKARAYLLAITFIPNAEVNSYNQVHYITDKNVDKLTNLVWSNQSEATKKNWKKGMLKDRGLTDEEITEIKDLVLSGAPYSYGKLSRKYGVHSFVISNLIKNLIAKKQEERTENMV